MEETLKQRFTEDAPAKLIGDRTYDSDPLDEKLKAEYGVVLVAPRRENA